MLLAGEGPKIVPLRVAHGYFVDPEDPDPRGMTVVSADRIAVGAVRDIWVDRSEVLVRYLEVELAAMPPAAGAAPTPRVVLLPINFAEFDAGRGRVTVSALMARNFADVPGAAERRADNAAGGGPHHRLLRCRHIVCVASRDRNR